MATDALAGPATAPCGAGGSLSGEAGSVGSAHGPATTAAGAAALVDNWSPIMASARSW